MDKETAIVSIRHTGNRYGRNYSLFIVGVFGMGEMLPQEGV